MFCNAYGIGRFAMIFKEENDNRRGDGDAKEQANCGDENHQGVHLRRKVGSLLRIDRQLRLHGLVSSSFHALGSGMLPRNSGGRESTSLVM